MSKLIDLNGLRTFLEALIPKIKSIVSGEIENLGLDDVVKAGDDFEEVNFDVNVSLIDKFNDVETRLDSVNDTLNSHMENSLSEQDIIEILNENVPLDITDRLNEVENMIIKTNKSMNTLENKMVDILIYLNMSKDTEIDDVGYWADPLTDSKNITFIDGLVLDTDSGRIKGAPGSVIFKDLNVPFDCNELKISVDYDNNFTEGIISSTFDEGSNIIEIDEYVYDVK